MSRTIQVATQGWKIRLLGKKFFELSDHLGNVTMTVSDRKQLGGSPEGYGAQVLSYEQYYPFGSTQGGRGASSVDYRFGFNGKENDPELNEGNQDFGARMYEGRIGRWWGVDPIIHEWQSPYSGIDNSPIYKIDPDGRSGEPVIKNGIMYIYMDFYVYGNSNYTKGNNFSILNQIIKLSDNLNENPTKLPGPDGKEYPVQFIIKAKLITNSQAVELAKNNVNENYDPKVNLVRLEDNVSPARNSKGKNLIFRNGVATEEKSRSVTGADNSMIVSPSHMRSTTFTHEVFAHGLIGRGNNSHIFDWKDNPSSTIPSIRAQRFTRNLPPNLVELYTDKYGTTGNVLKTEFREVLQGDVELIKIYDWEKDKEGNWRGRIGGATNTYFDENGLEGQGVDMK